LLSNYVGNLIQVGLRLGLTALLVIPVLISKKISIKISGISPAFFSIYIISFPLFIIFFTLSVNSIKIVNAFFFLFIGTLVGSFAIGYWYFQEKLNVLKTISLVITLMGLSLFVFPLTQNIKISGILFGLFGGLSLSISNATRKLATDRINRWVVIFYQMAVGSAIAFIITLLMGEDMLNKWDMVASIILIVFALGLILVQILYFIGFKNFNLNLGSIVLASQLIFVQFIGVLVFREVPTLNEGVGSMLVLMSIILVNWGALRQKGTGNNNLC